MPSKPKTAELDAEIARLYALPLEEFIAARNALATQWKKEGNREAADEIRSLTKPPASAWAVNQLFVRERQRMDDLLDAGARAREAQGETIAGAGAAALRKSLQSARSQAEDLRRRAVAMLSEQGRASSSAVTERIGADLQALAFSPSTAEVAKRGWLDSDLDPPGFEILAGLQIAAGGARLAPARPAAGKPASPEPHPGTPKAQKARGQQAKEDEKVRERQEKEEAKRRERQEREEAKLRERLTRAENEASRTASEADFSRRKAEQSEKAAEEAKTRAEEAREAASQALQRSERAAEALERLRKEIAEAVSGRV